MCISESPIRLQANFLAEILQARREWNDVFKVLKENDKRECLNQEHTLWESYYSELKVK